jgi:hypothetical protein
MGDTASTGRPPVGAILAIVGGALLGVGSFLAWAEVSTEGITATARGTDGDGYFTLAAGALAIVSGVLILRLGKRSLAIIAIIAGLFGAGVATYDAFTAEDSVLDEIAEQAAASVGIPAEQARLLLEQAVDAGEVQLDVSLGTGIYVAIAGGLLALVGGIMSLRGSEQKRGQAASGWAPPTSDEPPAAVPSAPPASEANPPAAPPAPAPPPTEDGP